MATKKTEAARPALDPEALYQVEMLRVVQTTAFAYRPGDEHRMTGAALEALAETAGAPVEDIAKATPIDG